MSSTRLYASSIAIVSGLYSIAISLWQAMASQEPMMGAGLGIGGWLMLTVGIVVLVHGVVLLTPAVGTIRRVSGPLMIVWALMMLFIQGAGATLPGFGMAPMDGALADGMGWDAGMVAIAILMLVSGLIMTSRRSDAAM